MIRLCNLILLLYVLSERRSGILIREYWYRFLLVGICWDRLGWAQWGMREKKLKANHRWWWRRLWLSSAYYWVVCAWGDGMGWDTAFYNRVMGWEINNGEKMMCIWCYMYRWKFMYKFVGGIVWGCTVFIISNLYVHVYPMFFVWIILMGWVTGGIKQYFLLILVVS